MCVGKKSPDWVSSLVVLVSIIQSRPLSAFNGPSANVLSGQRGPGAQRHFNGCNDESLKSDRGDRVSIAGTAGVGETGEGSEGRRQMALLGRYETGWWGGGRKNRGPKEEGGKWSVRIPLFAGSKY